MRHPAQYLFQTTGLEIRPYQNEPFARILDSIKNHYGDEIVIIFPRQSGKDEFLLNLKMYLADLYSVLPVSMVEVNPTYKPQTLTALLRFEQALEANILTRKKWKKRGDFMRILGQLRISFLSGEKGAQVVGSTASLVLLINEAQDIAIDIYTKKFEPMASSTNATRVFLGTVWTSTTLLAQKKQSALRAQKKDGRKRVFIVDTNEVRKYVSWYGDHVDNVIKTQGRQHPLVKTQYFNEEIDAVTGMFPAKRLALMQGDQDPQEEPIPGHIYGFTIDVAGVDESMFDLEEMSNPSRNKTTLDIIDIDLSSIELLGLPTYRVVARFDWLGDNHVDIFGGICALADNWNPQYIVEDQSGVGEGLYSMLMKKYPSKTLGVKFSAPVKSELGYTFIGIIESGRFRDCVHTEEVNLQYVNCRSEILIGPQKTMRWGVKDGTRNKATGELIFDDFILADALTAMFDKFEWVVGSPTLMTDAVDVIEEMGANF